MAYTDWKLCCWLVASALCVVNKVLLFKHVQARLFSFPLHIASGSLGLMLGTVQSEKHQLMLVLMPAAWSTVHSLLLMLRFSRSTAQDGLALLAAFLLTRLWTSCYFRTQSKMRSKQLNKFNVPATSGGENIYCLTTSHLWYRWLVQWRHSLLLQRQGAHFSQCWNTVCALSKKIISYKSLLLFVVVYLTNKRN